MKTLFTVLAMVVFCSFLPNDNIHSDSQCYRRRGIMSSDGTFKPIEDWKQFDFTTDTIYQYKWSKKP